MSLIVACVNVGQKYPWHYVDRLHSMVRRHLKEPFEFVVITDDVVLSGAENTAGIRLIRASKDLPGFWAKLMLFDTSWRADHKTIFLDLDTVVLRDLAPLAAVDHNFAIAANFTRAAGHPTWPCAYGSCVMVLGPGFGLDIWRRFWADRQAIMEWCGNYGDQRAIEALYPGAVMLQDILPTNFLMSYRSLTDQRPDDAAVICFGGKHKPDNSAYAWVKEEWR